MPEIGIAGISITLLMNQLSLGERKDVIGQVAGGCTEEKQPILLTLITCSGLLITFHDGEESLVGQTSYTLASTNLVI